MSLREILTEHYYDVQWSKERQGFRCVCGWLGEDHVEHVAGILAGICPSRDAIVEALYNVRGLGPNNHRNHGYDAFCPVCMSNPYRIADALVAAGLVGDES